MTQSCTCKNPECNKPFGVVDQEEKFLAKKELPLPDYCPRCRHKKRMALRNERELYKRPCDNCNNSMLSTTPESAPYKIYCQKCFWENIG